MIVSLVASRVDSNENRHNIMVNDVSRAYFYAPSLKPTFVEICQTDFQMGMQRCVGNWEWRCMVRGLQLELCKRITNTFGISVDLFRQQHQHAYSSFGPIHLGNCTWRWCCQWGQWDFLEWLKGIVEWHVRLKQQLFAIEKEAAKVRTSWIA